ncbi:MAG: ABC transporter substrate-binding protein, partial [Candidatus Bathyarchaeia archaeon]
MDKKMLSWLLVALMILSVSVVPAFAWTYPDCTEDEKYELFGPRADRYYIYLYADEESEWSALEAHQIDLGDWPLTKDKVLLYSQPPYSDYIKLHNYGAEYGFRVIDLNNNPNPYLGNPQDPAYPNPVYPNPMGVSSFRHAIAHLVDRTFIIQQFWGGLAVPMYTELVPSQAGVHPEIRPGGLLEDLTHPYNPNEAANILTDDGFVDTDGNGWRNFPPAIGGDGNDVVLKFYIRSDDTRRRNLGDWLANQLEADPVKIKVQRIYKTSYGCWLDVMVGKNFHMYTGGWGVGVDPDTGDLYSIDYYWHPGFCYNYDAVNCSEFEYWHKKVIYGNTFEEVLEAVLHEQEAFCTPSCIGAIPVLAMGPSIQPQHRTYTGNEPGEEGYNGQYWNGIVNIVGYGPDSYWSLLNMYPECSPMGDCSHMTIRRGFKVAELKKLNPVYAEWTWDWEVLGVIYDSLGYRNPYQLLEWKPFLIRSYQAFSWVDPSDGQTKSGMRFTLRNDIQWSDGVPFSAADIEYTLVEFPKKVIGAGFPPPWWWSSVRYIKSFYQIDPCNIEILLDIKTYFAIG